ncbi:MAG: tRNA uridine-5-carboxymethylaminomethyl(34) synthesis GTPase MnmE [Sphingomicrobium sp.]
MARDTIFALSSGRPPAAVAVIRVSGPAAFDCSTLVAGGLPEQRTAALREIREAEGGKLLDRAIILRFDSPATATGENIVEFQCHGGRAIVDIVLSALGSLPAFRPAEPGEFTRRAFENGRIDLTEAEGLADLIEAETEAQRRAALVLAEGGLRRQIALWQQRLMDLSAAAERAIDYDEDDEALDPALSSGCAALAAELGEWLARPRVEPLRDGVRIVVAGPPNSGKSSLVNAIAGEDRAIVTSLPGTTRDQIDVPLSIGGMAVVLTDTAGLRQTTDVVEAIGVARARALVDAAEILLWLGDPDGAPDHPNLILIHARADVRGPAPSGAIPVSAKTGDGIAQLLEQMTALASPLLGDGGAIALNRRQARHIAEAQCALADAGLASDILLVAENLRSARMAFDLLTGRAGVEDVLDSLFGRFCLGK